MRDLKLNASTFAFICGELGKLIVTDKSYRISLKEWREKRSLNQNSLFHVWCKQLSIQFCKKDRRYTETFVKDMLKHTFLGYEEVMRVNVMTREKYYTQELRHTSKLDKGEMKYFMDQVYAWAVNIGILLSIPEDCEYKRLKELEAA